MIKVTTTRTRSNSVALEALADTHVIEIPKEMSSVNFVEAVLGEKFLLNNFSNEEGVNYALSGCSIAKTNIIVHIKTGLRFLLPE